MKRLRHWLLRCTPAFTALILLLPLLAWARAGGGGHYGGGGSHGYSGGGGYGGGYSGNGDGSGIWYILYWLIELLFRYPRVGVPLLLLFIAWWMFNNHSNRGTLLVGETRMTRAIARGQAAQESARMGAATAQIRQRDPAFDEQQFLARVAGAFLKVQEAWSRQDMQPARGFVSDGVMERFEIQIGMQKADGIRNEMSAVNVANAAIVEAESDSHFDTLHVRLSANAVDTEVSLADGHRLSGSGQQEPFVEIWSFLRKPGAQTLQKPGPVEGCCPSCGAPLEITDAARCSSCKAWVNSGEYDWVLCEITQESEWAVRGSGEAVPGFTTLAQQDPALNTQFLEDRASVAFWRWQLALAQGNAKALLPVASEGWCQDWEADPASRHYRYRNAAVGAVEVRAFETGGPLNLAHVAVKWSGEAYVAGSGPGQSLGLQLREHVFVLGRHDAVRTTENSGLNSCRCPNCGAPPASREDPRCGFCGTAFNDGTRQWIVTQIVPIASWRMPQTAAAAAAAAAPSAVASGVTAWMTPAATAGVPPSAPMGDPSLGWTQGLSSTEALAVLVSAMMADGNIDAKEQKLLDRYARNNHIAPEVVAGAIEAARQGHLQIPLPNTPQEAHACLDGLIGMSLADGKVDPAELKLILAYAEAAGLKRDVVVQRIKDIRLSLYRQS
jgi:uncharacterized membrane protein YebE (DUF533 family)